MLIGIISRCEILNNGVIILILMESEEIILVELLAPAGSREAFRAAIESGADAVYLAGASFGARAYADNFDAEGLREAIRFAHLRGVHVHVTVNTIVDDQELAKLADYLRFLYEAGADAVLVQDLGVARLAREVVPALPLHASTQMTVHNLAGVRALEAVGFSRIVLSRELSIKDIRYICANSRAEIEVFIHGALCVCYSGQCLMSSMIGGRSGNRGRCAQPCRLPYTLVDGQGADLLADTAGKYLLSPRDLNTIDILPELMEAGVASLKIEGRMKRPEYVAVVVDTYRRAVDSYLSGEGYAVSAEDRRSLSQIFNRDFTTAYLKDRPGRNMMSDRRPNNRGILAGRVVRIDYATHRVTLHLSDGLRDGDQVDFWVKVGGRVTAVIHDMQDATGRPISAAAAGEDVSFPLDGSVRVHDRVFKVFDARLMEKARGFFTTGAPVRRIPLSIEARVAVGEPLVLRLKDRDGYTAEARTSFIGEVARKRPLQQETLQKQLSRLGTTVFTLEHLKADIQGEVMVPVSEINEVRREAVEKLEAQRLQAFARQPLAAQAPAPLPVLHRRHSETAALVVAVDSVEKARAALDAGADWLLFGGESYSHTVLTARHYQEVWQLAMERGRRVSFNTPRIVREQHMKAFLQLLESFSEFPPTEINIHNIGMLALVREHTDIPIHADYSLIAYNALALAEMKDLGAASATLSPELTMAQVERLAAESPLPLECIADGQLELMVSEYCVTGSFLGGIDTGACSRPCQTKGQRYALEDRKKEHFPLVMDQFCHMHVLNGKKLSMLPHAMKFGAMGISRIRIEARAMDAAELRDTVKNYRRFLALPAELSDEELALAKKLEGPDITRGHYFRGVL